MQADSFSRKGAGQMKERLQQLLSEAGESFDYLKSDIRNLSRFYQDVGVNPNIIRLISTQFATLLAGAQAKGSRSLGEKHSRVCSLYSSHS
jgi:hypothetical protein